MTTEKKNTPHGWRITWPMVVGWIGVLALLWPTIGPYVLGEKPFDTAAGALILSTLLAALNHSPAPSGVGGFPRPPTGPTALLVAFVLALPLLAGCGAGWQSQGVAHLGLASRATVFADRMVQAEQHTQCPDGNAECVHAHHFDAAADAIAAAKASIEAGEAALLHAIDTGVQNVWDRVAPCIAAAVAAVMHALIDAEVSIPTWVGDVAAAVVAMLGPCPSSSP